MPYSNSGAGSIVACEQISPRSIEPLKHDDGRVAELDPIRLDPWLTALSSANASADLRGLTALLSSLVEAVPAPNALSVPESLAAMRDLGIVMGSIKRHGAEPVEVVPGLERLLLCLGDRSGMVPRDTVHHYTAWNPTGKRERTYTGDRNEKMLISAVRITVGRLSSAVEQCERLVRLELDDLDFVVAANELVALLNSLEASIDSAITNVNPYFFARVLRPYYCDVRVGSARYLGPSGAHVPLALVDLALWASDHGGPEYRDLWEKSVKYGLPGWHQLSERWARTASLVTRLSEAFSASGRDVSTNLTASAEALTRALRILVRFRGKHLPLARKAYAADVKEFPTGSGGATVHQLEKILELTKLNARMARESFVRL